MTYPSSKIETITDSNSVDVWRTDNNEPVAIKQYFAKPFNFKMLKYTLLRYFGRQVPVEYQPPQSRRDFEKTCLEIWTQKGFDAPQLKALPQGYKTVRPALAMAYIDGRRLDHLLASPDTDLPDKMAAVKAVFAEMKARHCMALFERNHKLIHFDANIRNIMMKNGRSIHIDFEMGRLNESIDRSAAREVLKFSLQAANHIGAELLEDLIGELVLTYNIRQILKRIVDENLNQRLLRYHLKKDSKRKAKNPGLVTRLDLADALKRRILHPASGKRTDGPTSKQLHQALETSWDGKFYQSLDDSDPRGRDMRHRYEIMQFPDDFKGLSVLDIGCNIGRICFDAKQRGAARAVGIDNREDVVNAMNGYYKEKGVDVELFAFDINQGYNGLKRLVGDTHFDYIFALSIWSHIDKQKLWDIINGCKPKVFILEDNAPSRIKITGTDNQHSGRQPAFFKNRISGVHHGPWRQSRIQIDTLMRTKMKIIEKWRDPLVWIFLLAFGIRLYACLSTAIVNPDGLKYLYQAKALYLHQWDSLTSCSMTYLSILPIFISLAYCLFHDWIVAGRFVTLTFSFATLFPLYLIAKRFFDRSTTLLVMLVFAFIPALVGRSADIIRGPIFWFFLSMGMYLFIRSGENIRPQRYNIFLPLSCLFFIIAVWGRIEGVMFIVVSAGYLLIAKSNKRFSRLFYFLSPLLVFALIGVLALLLSDKAYLQKLRLDKIINELKSFLLNYQAVRDNLHTVAKTKNGLLYEFYKQVRDVVWLVPIGPLLNCMLEKFFYPYVLIYFIGLIGSRKKIFSEWHTGYFFWLSLGGFAVLYVHILNTWLIYDRFLAIIILPAVLFIGYGCNRTTMALHKRFNLKPSTAVVIMTVFITMFGLGKNLRPRYEEKSVIREMADTITKQNTENQLVRIAASPSIYYRWLFFYTNKDHKQVVCDNQLIGTIKSDYRTFVSYLKHESIAYVLWSQKNWPHDKLDLMASPYRNDFDVLGEWDYHGSDKFILLKIKTL